MEKQFITPKKYISLLLGILIFLGLYLISLSNYLLFHSLAEIFSIVIACGIFIMAWNSHRFLENDYLLFIGIAYLFVAGVDLVHTLAYKGMGIFQGYETNLSTQLWITARYVQSLSLFIAPFFFRRKLKINLVFLGYTVIVFLLLMSIFYWNIFPVCFIEGIGLTPFKKINEYIISLILLGSIILLLKKRNEFDSFVLQCVVGSIILTIVSELAFTFYIDAYGLSNLIGHLFKILAFYFIYKAIIETGLKQPYDLMFRNLKKNEEALRRSRDELERRIEERTAELIRANADLWKRTNELNERVKEINCLYSISYYVGKQYGLLEEKLQSIVDLIPSGWQYPEIACARIILEDKEYKTGNFKETPWRQASDIILHDEKIGTVEIYYLEKKPMNAEGPFLKEERSLINSIAIELSEMMGYMRAEKALREQSRILEAFFTSTITPLVFLDRDFNFIRVNEAYAKACQRDISEFPGHNHFEFYPHEENEDIFRQVLERKILHQAIAKPFLFPDHPEWGETYWDWNLTPILDQKGEVEFLVFSLNDVTERKRAEEAVISERQRFNDVLESLPAYLVLLTPDYHVTFANRFFRERFGESYGRRCFEYLFGRGEPCEICETYTVLKTMAPHEWDWTGPDGRNYHVFDFPFTDTDGSTLILEMGIDITERERAEGQLKAASLYARSLIEASLDPLVTIRRDGKIMDVNKATELVTGVSRNHLVGSDFLNYFTEPDKAREGYQQVFLEGTVRDYPLAIRHTSGHITYVLYNATVYKNEAGEMQGIFAAARDITERKRAEEALRAASLYTRSLIEASLDPLVTISADGKVMDVNRATESVTGVPREQLIGSDFSDYFTEPEKAREGYQEVFSKGSVRDYPLAIRHNSGRVTDVLYNASVYKNETGEVQGVFAAARDITERKRAEEALRESESRLRTLSSQLLTVQENERRRIAREIHDGIGQMLTAIKFKVEDTIQQKNKGKVKIKEKSLETVIPLIRESIEEVRRIQMDLRPSILDDLGILATVGWFCREFEKIYSTIRTEKLINIHENEVPVHLKTVIFRVMQEALNNVAKHSKADLVQVSLRKTDGTIELAIKDNGQGFNLNEVFSVESPKRGLGLSSMRERTELSSGSFFIESTAGKGTIIRACWPM